MANILQGMHALDSLTVDELRSLHTERQNDEDELLKLADEIDAWRLTEDDEHIQRLENNINMRFNFKTDILINFRNIDI